jgi:hypothetical protein
VRSSLRPTSPPSFDVAQFAKDSDAAIPTVRPRPLDESSSPPAEEQRSETRLATRPKRGAVIADEATVDEAVTHEAIGDEGWARVMVGAPILVMAHAELRRLPLDHRAGFLLSFLDGTIDLDTIVEVSGMPRGEALRIIRNLFESGVVAFR